MKKIYVLAVATIFTSALFGQNRLLNNAPMQTNLVHDSQLAPVKHTSLSNDKAPGDVIWSEDFTGGFPAGWTFNDLTGNGYDWVINNAPITGPFTTNVPGVASTSGGNHMLLFGDQHNPGPPYTEMDSYFQTDAIAITGQPSVSVRFDQKFRLCCTGAAALNLVVSTDPTFATNVATFNVRNGIALNATSPDPFTTSVNISSIAGGLTGNIYIRFHWALGASHYYWMVDDIEVIESFDNDIFTFQEYYGVENVPYTRIPASQVYPVDFSMQATNVGGVDQTNTVLTADINGGLFTGTSAPITLLTQGPAVTLAMATDSLFSTTSFTPPTTQGVPYTVTLTVASDSTDNTPNNNTFTFNPFEVSNSVYAQDDYGPTYGAGGGSTTNPSFADEFEAGNYYDCWGATNAESITVRIGTGTTIGGAWEVVLYDITTGSFVEVDRSIPVVVNAGDIGQFITLPLPLTPALTVGSYYFAAVHGFGGGNEFFYGTSGTSPDNTSKGGPTSLIFYPNMTAPNTGQNFYTSNTPVVRLNVTPAVIGIEDENNNNVSFNVYPNPSNGEFNINLDAKDSKNITLLVKNVLGEEVINKLVSVSGKTIETISLSDYSKGIYFLTIDNETVKLVVE